MSYFQNWQAQKESESITGDQGSNTVRAESKSILMNNFSLLGTIYVIVFEKGFSFVQIDRNEKCKATNSYGYLKY